LAEIDVVQINNKGTLLPDYKHTKSFNFVHVHFTTSRGVPHLSEGNTQIVPAGTEDKLLMKTILKGLIMEFMQPVVDPAVQCQFNIQWIIDTEIKPLILTPVMGKIMK